MVKAAKATAWSGFEEEGHSTCAHAKVKGFSSNSRRRCLHVGTATLDAVRVNSTRCRLLEHALGEVKGYESAQPQIATILGRVEREVRCQKWSCDAGSRSTVQNATPFYRLYRDSSSDDLYELSGHVVHTVAGKFLFDSLVV